jgi:hypothetical protein
MLITVCGIVYRSVNEVVLYFWSMLLLLPLRYKYSNHTIPTHPHYKHFPDEFTPILMYNLIMNTALFEEML